MPHLSVISAINFHQSQMVCYRQEQYLIAKAMGVASVWRTVAYNKVSCMALLGKAARALVMIVGGYDTGQQLLGQAELLVRPMSPEHYCHQD